MKHHKSILAALLFFGLFLLGLKLSAWQYSRYQMKFSIERQSREEVAQKPGLYQTFKAEVSIRPMAKPLISLMPRPTDYQVYCPVILSLSDNELEEIGYLKVKQLMPARPMKNSDIARFCQRQVDNQVLSLALMPVQRNRFIKKDIKDFEGYTQVNQLSDIDHLKQYYIQDPNEKSFYVVTPLKHLGYSIQWLGLALCALFFCFLVLKQRF